MENRNKKISKIDRNWFKKRRNTYRTCAFCWEKSKFDGIPHEGHYTQEEIKEIIEYAEERYVEIIPEIDMPGHTASLIASYPELGTSKEKINVKKIWGVQDDILIPTENTFNFLENIISELVTLFPPNIYTLVVMKLENNGLNQKKFRE